ncbi:MAG: hypothetical protein K8T89_04850 [Planctomycetes bacterium]|nr:hypothetical protein [Planctomycetota bacterium]
MMRYVLISACVLSFSIRGFSAEPATPDAVNDAIQKLAHARFAVRDQAARNLVRIGEPALIPLKAVLASKDLEVRLRAEALIQQIETRIENETLIRASKLRLKYQNTPLDEAIVDLAKRTGLPFALDEKSGKNPRQQITLDTGEVPYWEAVEKFLTVAGLEENATNALIASIARKREDRSGISPLEKPDIPAERLTLVECKKPIAASTSTIVRVKSLPRDFPGNVAAKGTNEVTFKLDVIPAKSFVWQELVGVEIRKAIDDRGNVLTQSHLPREYDQAVAVNNAQDRPMNNAAPVFQAPAPMYSPQSSPGTTRHMPVTLFTKDTSAKTLKHLEGVVVARVLSLQKTLLTFDNLLKAKMGHVVQNDDMRLRIVERTVQKNGNLRLKLRIVVSTLGEGMTFDESHDQGNDPFKKEVPARVNRLSFVDSVTGKPIPDVSISLLELFTDDEYDTIDYAVILPGFGKADANPVNWVITARRTVTVEIPFLLKDVPLP